MIELAAPHEYEELLMPAVVQMADTPGYADCFPALQVPGAMAILSGHVHAMANAQHVFLLVDRAADGSSRGFVLGYIQPQWYSHELEGVQEFLWVEPVYRNGMVLRRLMRHFEEECAARGAAFVTIGVSSGNKVDAFCRMAHHMGYRTTQINFKKCIRR